jgi:hypothetical protein
MSKLVISAMRILLDSRDLINVLEQKSAVSVGDLDSYLSKGNHEIILCFSNIRELVSPLADGASYLDLRPRLQDLERLRHTYMKEVGIVGIELRAAVDAFSAGTEFVNPSPFVDRWDKTMSLPPGHQRPVTDYLVNVSLDNLVYWTYKGNRTIFEPMRKQIPQLRKIMEDDRTLLRTGKLPAKEHFVGSVKKHATTHRVKLPAGREDEFALWIYRDVNRCPGFRLNHEIFRSLTGNYQDVAEPSDFTDLALTFALPYVDAATLDRRIRDYCQRACRKLGRLNVAHNYRERVYDDVADLLRRT